jgi:DNA-binding CsgD family transcriptional regulator
MYKGEECLGIGTIKELAEQFKVNIKTIKFYLTPTYKKRVKKSKNRRELVFIGSD